MAHRVNDRLDRMDPADDDDGDTPVQVLYPPQEFDSAHARQPHVGNDQIDRLLLQPLQRALGRGVDDQRDLLILMAGQFMLDRAQEHVHVARVVLDQQDREDFVLGA